MQFYVNQKLFAFMMMPIENITFMEQIFMSVFPN
jgi:hypothetical protein